MEQNALFITNDKQLYGQVRRVDAESTVNSLNKDYPNLKWRIDTHQYVFCSNPTIKQYGGCKFNNPNQLVSDDFVWITCIPEIFECTVVDNNEVFLDPGLFNCIPKELIEFNKTNDEL